AARLRAGDVPRPSCGVHGHAAGMGRHTAPRLAQSGGIAPTLAHGARPARRRRAPWPDVDVGRRDTIATQARMARRGSGGDENKRLTLQAYITSCPASAFFEGRTESGIATGGIRDGGNDACIDTSVLLG